MIRSSTAAAIAACLGLVGASAFAQSAKTSAKPLSPSQMSMAERVYTGEAQCDANQKVHVQAVHGKPGTFMLKFKNKAYAMVPEDTTTGAVRLEDKKAGVVWLQIANKSMLMNSKIGQRMVDGCKHPQQA